MVKGRAHARSLPLCVHVLFGTVRSTFTTGISNCNARPHLFMLRSAWIDISWVYSLVNFPERTKVVTLHTVWSKFKFTGFAEYKDFYDWKSCIHLPQWCQLDKICLYDTIVWKNKACNHISHLQQIVICASLRKNNNDRCVLKGNYPQLS